jgi:hypothetical protein
MRVPANAAAWRHEWQERTEMQMSAYMNTEKLGKRSKKKTRRHNVNFKAPRQSGATTFLELK